MADMFLVIYAHPYPQHSRASRALLAGVRQLPDVQVRSLYDLYPDYDIDVAAEQRAVEQAEVVAGFPTFGTGTLQISLPMGEYNYLFLHWGGPNVDVFYQNPQLYYIGGEAGSLTFTAPVYSEQIPVVYFTSGSRAGQIKKAAGVVNHQYGLSFYSFYSEISVITPTPGDPPSTSLPDSGTSVVLLGAGLAGIVGLRRSWAKRS